MTPSGPGCCSTRRIEELLAALPSAEILGRVHPGAHLVGDRIVLGKGSRIAPGAVVEGPALDRRGCRGPRRRLPARRLLGGRRLRRRRERRDEARHPLSRRPRRAPELRRRLDPGPRRRTSAPEPSFRTSATTESEIEIPTGNGERLATGKRKLGAIVGDRVAVGCNSVLNPGTIVGARTQIYTGVQLRERPLPRRQSDQAPPAARGGRDRQPRELTLRQMPAGVGG